MNRAEPSKACAWVGQKSCYRPVYVGREGRDARLLLGFHMPNFVATNGPIPGGSSVINEWLGGKATKREYARYTCSLRWSDSRSISRGRHSRWKDISAIFACPQLAFFKSAAHVDASSNARSAMPLPVQRTCFWHGMSDQDVRRAIRTNSTTHAVSKASCFQRLKLAGCTELQRLGNASRTQPTSTREQAKSGALGARLVALLQFSL